MDKEDVVYIYTMEYYLALKKSEPMPFVVTRVHLEIIILSKVSQKDKCDITYMWNLKYATSEFIHQTDSDIENKLMITKGER